MHSYQGPSVHSIAPAVATVDVIASEAAGMHHHPSDGGGDGEERTAQEVFTVIKFICEGVVSTRSATARARRHLSQASLQAPPIAPEA